MKTVNEQRVTRHSATPLDTDSSGCFQHHAADAEIPRLFGNPMFIAVFTRSQHGTYPEPDQSSHTLTYYLPAVEVPTVACTATARTTEQSRFEFRRLSRPALEPTKPPNKEATSHRIRTVQLHRHGVYKENHGKLYRQQDALIVSALGAPDQHFVPISCLHLACYTPHSAHVFTSQQLSMES
jgi:hypothetical protein